MQTITSLSAILSECAVPPPRDDVTLQELGHLHVACGRAAVIARLREAGSAAGHAGKIANSIGRAIREGRVDGIVTPPQESSGGPRPLDLRSASRLGNAAFIAQLLRSEDPPAINATPGSDGTTPLMEA